MVIRSSRSIPVLTFGGVNCMKNHFSRTENESAVHVRWQERKNKYMLASIRYPTQGELLYESMAARSCSVVVYHLGF